MEGVFFISFYETMLLQQKQLQQKLTDIQKQLQQLPEGKLICTRCGNRTKWYRSDGHTKTYIPKTRNLMPLSLLSDVIFWKSKRNIKLI
jgi:hypothetical protein